MFCEQSCFFLCKLNHFHDARLLEYAVPILISQRTLFASANTFPFCINHKQRWILFVHRKRENTCLLVTYISWGFTLVKWVILQCQANKTVSHNSSLHIVHIFTDLIRLHNLVFKSRLKVRCRVHVTSTRCVMEHILHWPNIDLKEKNKFLNKVIKI